MAPYPAPGCPGYTAYWIPEGSCLWVHGRFHIRIPDACDLASGGDLVHTCSIHTSAREGGLVRYFRASDDGRGYKAERLEDCQGACD